MSVSESGPAKHPFRIPDVPSIFPRHAGFPVGGDNVSTPVFPAPPEPRNNHALAMLEADAYQQLLPSLQLVHTDFKQEVFRRDHPIEHVYFPCSGAFSVLTYLQNGIAVEVGTIGNEGVVGIDLVMGMDRAMETTVCQVAGYSFRMRAMDFKAAIADDSPLRHATLRFMQSYVAQISQSVACNRVHTIEQRFCRWVLMTHDRVKSDTFHLTQEFLADMLGVHRPSVSAVAGAFQQAGMIRYSRGNLTILNRAGLEQSSCECYHSVKHRTHHLLGMARG